jgi:hypothetical protein
MIENTLAVTGRGVEGPTRDLAIWVATRQLDVLRAVEYSGSRHGTGIICSAWSSWHEVFSIYLRLAIPTHLAILLCSNLTFHTSGISDAVHSQFRFQQTRHTSHHLGAPSVTRMSASLY